MGFSRRTGGRRRTGGNKRIGGRRRTGGMGVVGQAAVPFGLLYMQKHMQKKGSKSRKSRGGGVSGMLSKFKNALGGGRTRRVGGRRRHGSRRR